MNLRQILPLEVNFKIKNSFQFIQQRIPNINKDVINKSKKVFFLDAPAYGNLGDQAICFAMQKFVHDVLPEYEQIEIQEDEFPFYARWIKQNITQQDIICLTGGGNMGVMYQRYEAIRRIIISWFPNNRIFIFPQTFDYGESSYGNCEVQRAQKVYSKAKKLVMSARERTSYEKMRKSFPDVNVILCPDIVLYLDYLELGAHAGEVAFCLRDDKEVAITQHDLDELVCAFPEHSLLSTYVIPNSHIKITVKNRQKILENKLSEFAHYQLIVTDRLHGMIFAYITGTPCIALPNSNGKVEAVYEWIKDSGVVVFQKSFSNRQDYSPFVSNTIDKNMFKKLETELLKGN